MRFLISGRGSIEPMYRLEPHDHIILYSLGIDPEMQEGSVDEELTDLFEHIKEIRIRKGEWV